MEDSDRIAAFNGETGSLSFENAPAETKWLLAAQEESSSPFSYVKVDYNNLGQYLAYTASGTAENYIEIVGTIPSADFTGTGSNPGEFGKKIKAEGSKKIALKLPERVAGLTDIRWCFKDCANLVSLAHIPESVTNMQGCFEDCTALTQAPVIPASVENMARCFSECTKLERVKLECNYKSDGSTEPFQAVFQHCIALQPGGIKVKTEYYANYTRATALSTKEVPGSSEDEKRAKFSTFD